MPRLLLLLLLSAACTTAQAPPGDNPLTAGGGGPVGDAPAPPETSTAWKQVGAVDIAAGLTATVATEAKCCNDKKDEVEGSPARFFLALASPGSSEGYALYLDSKGHTVFAGQEEPGKYSIELFRSVEPAGRSDGIVTHTVPASSLPTGPLLIWAGTRSASTVNGTDLPLRSPDGSIPTLRLDGPNDVVVEEIITPEGEDGAQPPDPEGRPPEGDLPPDPEGRPPEGKLPPDPEGRPPEGEPPVDAIEPEDKSVDPPAPEGNDLPTDDEPESE
ncbi:MAG: hypothetical protein GY898_30420 [Proteobacteria bacterium]|nr:hypothetical protein [Pseudomonadota bacterium]